MIIHALLISRTQTNTEIHIHLVKQQNNISHLHSFDAKLTSVQTIIVHNPSFFLITPFNKTLCMQVDPLHTGWGLKRARCKFVHAIMVWTVWAVSNKWFWWNTSRGSDSWRRRSSSWSYTPRKEWHSTHYKEMTSFRSWWKIQRGGQLGHKGLTTNKNI